MSCATIEERLFYKLQTSSVQTFLPVMQMLFCTNLKSSVMNVPGRLAVCVKLTVTQLVKPHRPTCFLGQLNKVN